MTSCKWLIDYIGYLIGVYDSKCGMRRLIVTDSDVRHLAALVIDRGDGGVSSDALYPLEGIEISHARVEWVLARVFCRNLISKPLY